MNHTMVKIVLVLDVVLGVGFTISAFCLIGYHAINANDLCTSICIVILGTALIAPFCFIFWFTWFWMR